MKKYFYYLFLVLGPLFGCDRPAENLVIISEAMPGYIVTNQATRSWINLPNNYPIVAVGQKTISKSEIEYLAEHIRKDAQIRLHDQKQFNKVWSRMRVELPWKIISDFIARSAFVCEAESLNVSPTLDDEDSARVAISNRFSNFSAKFNEFARHYPKSGWLDEMISQEAKAKAVFRVLFSNSLDVTESEVDETLLELNRLQAQSVTNNQSLMLRCEKFVSEFNQQERLNVSITNLPSGFCAEAFEDAPASAFDDEEEFLRVTSLLSNGKMSRPCVTDSNIEMYVITNSTEKIRGRPRQYSGVKYFVEKDLGYEIPPRDKLLGHMKELRNLQIVQPKLQQLMRKYGVVFTQGFIWKDKTSPYSASVKGN